jgi:hypothetical protein
MIMDEEQLIEFLSKNLRIEIDEETFGFNGISNRFSLKLCDKEISYDTITIVESDD